MHLRPQVSALLAMLAGAPATIAGVVLLPWSLIFGVYGFSEAPLEALGNLGLGVAGAFALANYWYLAARTLKEQRYVFGWAFRLSLLAAMVVGTFVFVALPVLAAVIIVVPICLATYWFVQQQLRRKLIG